MRSDRPFPSRLWTLTPVFVAGFRRFPIARAPLAQRLFKNRGQKGDLGRPRIVTSCRTEDMAIDSTVTLSGSPKSGELPGREWEIQPLNVVIANYVAAAVEAADGNVHIGAPSV